MGITSITFPALIYGRDKAWSRLYTTINTHLYFAVNVSGHVLQMKLGHI